MDLCDQCGNKSLMPEHYSDVYNGSVVKTKI